jgi:uncharacterized protein (DUF302 family)
MTGTNRLTTAFAFAFAIAAAPGMAQEAVIYPFDGTFEEANFAVESEIVGQGLVIDYVSHVGDMLNRTGADVGSDAAIFDQATIHIFCSALVSRKVMEADWTNLAHCPYGIFVADRAGEVSIGYRTYPEGEMQEVQALLDAIARAAAEG